MIAWSLFLFSVCSSSLSQYWQKKAAMLFMSTPALAWHQKLLSRPILLSILFLGISALSWLAVLSLWDVSSAYPLLSINFVVMLLLSHFIFHEPISSKQIIGVFFIVFGIIILSGALE
ncbi:EamA family transporter [Shewanella surugensis]|uniref:EamA family transporter n=1 Tax=Shewanella surugensis TaxID=212020 RepID=A0ABT0LGX2_9GAMM|nr:EamA family transporter [Shewanella surugensis]MCL1126929.1 EamA family transporter [Shewanella surugensis]